MLEELVKTVIALLRKSLYGLETETRVMRFSNDQDLNLKKLGNGKGVRSFSVKNIGKHIIFISTGANDEREPIYPEQLHIHNNPHRCVDESVIIEFGEIDNRYANRDDLGKEAIVRYAIDKC